MATTPQQVITNALVILGVLFPGQVAGPSMLTDAFTRLNNMLATWSTERLMVFAENYAKYSFSASQLAYTLGTGGSFAGPWPTSITDATIVTSTGLRYKCKPLTVDEWSAIVDQTATGIIPTEYYCDYQYPLANLKFHPTPNSSATSVELYSWQELAQFVTLADPFVFPPGYERAITYNLAAECDMVYGRPMTPDGQRIAMESKQALEGNNAPPTHLSGAAQEAMGRAQLAQATQALPTNANPPLMR
jgi:hypothetical protein